jgi:cell division protein FtsI (penicillin-binding protein 3)
MDTGRPREPVTSTRRRTGTSNPTRGGTRTSTPTRGRTGRHGGGRIGADGRRYTVGRWVMLGALTLAVLQLVRVQGIDATALAAGADAQRTSTVVLPATRGAITDRTGAPIAFTMEAKALTFQPSVVRASIAKARETDPSADTAEVRFGQIADLIHQKVPTLSRANLYTAMAGDASFVYLAKKVDPATASEITTAFPEVGVEREAIREYPGGALAANMVGSVGSDGSGLLGLEASMDSQLAGADGRRVVERGEDGTVIPGSQRDEVPAVNGTSVQLTLDSELQWFVQQAVQRAKDLSGARHASAVVLDVKTGQVRAMAHDGTFDPNTQLGTATAQALGNPSVSSPFEPGSVNKIIAASAAIDMGLTTPDEVLQVPGKIALGGVTVRDAWVHGNLDLTTTGVFGKSSNVGTLELAQRVGPDAYAQMLAKFGLGATTDVGLPGESAGSVPVQSQWSGSTFANLPIGQGLSMTLLQMTGMYQAIANDGVRIPPRIVASTTAPDGTVTATPQPDGVQVVSAQTAVTVRNMFRAVVQNDKGQQRGTGVAAAVAGYQVSGKTGTAQQVDPACGCYSDSAYNITFAGMAPADAPRFVVGIMLDNPVRSSDGTGGESSAPLFHEIASWLLQHDHVPLSPEPTPKLTLVAG